MHNNFICRVLGMNLTPQISGSVLPLYMCLTPVGCTRSDSGLPSVSTSFTVSLHTFVPVDMKCDHLQTCLVSFWGYFFKTSFPQDICCPGEFLLLMRKKKGKVLFGNNVKHFCFIPCRNLKGKEVHRCETWLFIGQEALWVLWVGLQHVNGIKQQKQQSIY